DRGVRADAERERHDDDECEAGRAAKRTERVAQVAAEIVEARDGARVAVEIARVCGAAERALRCGARIGGREAAAAEAVLEEREMRRHLALELRVGAGLPRRPDQPREKASHMRTGVTARRRGACSRARRGDASDRS